MKFHLVENWSWCRSAVTTQQKLIRNSVNDGVADVHVIGNTSSRGLRKKMIH
jgi:hypothetical protein